MGAVWAAEAMNTASSFWRCSVTEFLSLVRDAKDVAAGACW